MAEAAMVAVRAVSRLVGTLAGGLLLVWVISTSRLASGAHESVAAAAAPQAPEVGLVQHPAASKLPHLTVNGPAPAITTPAPAGAETATTQPATAIHVSTAEAATTKPTSLITQQQQQQQQQAVVRRAPVPTPATKKAIKKGMRKVLKKALRKIRLSAPCAKVAVRVLEAYDPAAAAGFALAGSAAVQKAVVVHSVGELVKAIHSSSGHAAAQIYSLAFTSERAHAAQQLAFDREVAAQAAQGVAVFVVVLGADFAQRAKLAAAEYCGRPELSALGAALDMQGAFGPDVALASLLPGAHARKDFMPPRLPCIAFGGLHQQSDVMWEAASAGPFVSTSDVDAETWALAAAMRVLPLSAPATLADAAETRRAQLHQLSCLQSKLQLGRQQQQQQAAGGGKIELWNAGYAAAARAATALAEAEAAEAEAVSIFSSSPSPSPSSSLSSTAAAYLPADMSHLVPTSEVDYLRRHAAATAAGKLLAVVRVSEAAWKDHGPAIRAALAAAAPCSSSSSSSFSSSSSSSSSVWAEPVLLPVGLGACGAHSLAIAAAGAGATAAAAAAALPALHVGGGGYLAEHWSAAADLLSGQAPAAGLSDMRQAIDLHAMRQRAWLRRREAVEAVVAEEQVGLMY
ncbi:hypothetical protein HYH02_012793 [Chlamydomonas schloesseri]|nr:hypothetical protein HYH02_012793 [Chlamydomonas schloesseri]|eukprot:KAG2433089.1 hypothetical protein HYH02_012793 [Chlamydomonas schloesseri]